MTPYTLARTLIWLILILRRIPRWLIPILKHHIVGPFVAVIAAIGLHWALNVPPGPLPPPGQKESDIKKPEPKPEPNKRGDVEPAEVNLPFTTPRSPGLLTQTWDAYDPVDFKNEPTFDAWSAAHRPLLNQLIASARLRAFKDKNPPPTVSTSNLECHTVRCRFTLSSAERADLETLLETLDGLHLTGAPLWHKFLPDPIELEPSKRKDAPVRNRVQVLVSFIRDLPPIQALTLRDGTPLKMPPLAPPPSGIPSSTLPRP